MRMPAQVCSQSVSHSVMHRLSARRDCIVYSAKCDKLDGITVVLKVYDKSRISPVKHRSVRREARIMRFLTERGLVLATTPTTATANASSTAALPSDRMKIGQS